MEFWIAFLVGGIILAVLVIGAYNKLVSMRQNVRESWSAIETELRRRYDLIPNIVETVKGYAAHEKDTLEAVVRARNAASTAGSLEDQVHSQNDLTGALQRLMALSEAYPELKANENFRQLQEHLAETETRISQARRFYNANVRELNTACESFPSSFIAGSFGFKQQPYFGIEEAEAFEPVKVNFSGTRGRDRHATLSLEKQDPSLLDSDSEKQNR